MKVDKSKGILINTVPLEDATKELEKAVEAEQKFFRELIEL
jgi:hypothetical protein